jgi:hypothetical protein
MSPQKVTIRSRARRRPSSTGSPEHNRRGPTDKEMHTFRIGYCTGVDHMSHRSDTEAPAAPGSPWCRSPQARVQREALRSAQAWVCKEQPAPAPVRPDKARRPEARRLARPSHNQVHSRAPDTPGAPAAGLELVGGNRAAGTHNSPTAPLAAASWHYSHRLSSPQAPSPERATRTHAWDLLAGHIGPCRGGRE